MVLAAMSMTASESPIGLASSQAGAQTASSDFPGGPTLGTAQLLYDEADLNRAIQTYKFFYPNISTAGLASPFQSFGPIDNNAFYILSGSPKQILFTPNSDTPYAALPLDLKAGPITVELPPGPLVGVANDFNFRWVMDMGVPGPEAGRGGKHIILPRNPGGLLRRNPAPTAYS